MWRYATLSVIILEVFCVFDGVLGPLSAGGRVLNIEKESFASDTAILRRGKVEGSPHKCQLLAIDAANVANFSISQHDLDSLETCPLQWLNLTNTLCFSHSLVDLSRLATLKLLMINYCRNTDFVITGLPTTLRYLFAWSSTEKNFQLTNTNARFGAALQAIHLGDASMCSFQTLVKMFGRGVVPIEKCIYDARAAGSHGNQGIPGLSEGGTELAIFTNEDVFYLRQELSGEACHLRELFVKLKDFALTQADIHALSRCPLTQIHLIQSKCFSESVIDLRKLESLTRLSVPFCRSSDFVITGLPASLQRLNIAGLAEFNIRLSSDSRFGDSLTLLQVHTAAMCCNNTMFEMFSRDLTSVCRGTDHSNCGLEKRGAEVGLQVDSRQRFHSELGDNSGDEARQRCQVSRLSAVGEEFFLTQEDVDILAGCPLRTIDLPYTSCFSGPVNLSRLSQLKMLFIPHCSNLDFEIRGLPATLQMLDMRGLKLDNIRVDNSANGFQLQQIEVSKLTICSCPQAAEKMLGRRLDNTTTCAVTDSVYSASTFFTLKAFTVEDFESAISSCEDLIDNPVLRGLLWTMAVFATCGNFTVVLSRLFRDRSKLNSSHNIYPFNLALSDLLMGIYLFIIAVGDAQFRGEYSLFDEEWRHGSVCQLAGFLSTLSSETSAMLILLITLDRLLVIQFPFGQHRISVKRAWTLSGVTWLTGFLIASLPLTISDWQVYSFNSICVGLPLNRDFYSGSGYATGIFIGVNSVLFLLIAVGQALIYRGIWVNSRMVSLNEKQAKRRYQQDLAVARQLSVIVMTDFLCWFPICVMGLMAQSGYYISQSAYAWSAVVVMPVNSSINPLIYTLKDVFTESLLKCLSRCRHDNKENVSFSGNTQTSST